MDIHSFRYIVYILVNRQGRKYIGMTADVSKRLIQHNAGFSTYTRFRGPWELHWNSFEMTYEEARKLETKMKKQKGGLGLTKILADHKGS